MKTFMYMLMATLLVTSNSCNKLPNTPVTPIDPAHKPSKETPSIYEVTDTVDMYFNQTHVFEGDTYRTEIHTRKPVLKRYVNKPVVQSLGDYILEEPGYPYIESVARQVYAPIARRNFTEDQERRYMIAFAQYLPYAPDPSVPGGGNLIKNPLVSLTQPSDCEDHVLVAYVLLEALGLNECRALCIPYATPTIGHMALGIRVDKPVGRTYYEKRTGKYFAYVEVTGRDYPIGSIWRDYAGKSVELIDLPHVRPIDPRILGRKQARRSGYDNTSGMLTAAVLSEVYGHSTDVIEVASHTEATTGYTITPSLPDLPKLPAPDIATILSRILAAIFKPMPTY